ncbi:Testis-expressed protein 30 [Entomortierella chlamydospora]|nr:Testis-expressed protein 30 [Entomortierella chlamydospora]
MSDPTEKEISIPWPGKSAIMVTLTTPPEGMTLSGFGLILGPGAGGDEKTPLLTAVAKEVAKQGHYCARYRARVPNLGFRVSVCSRVMEYLFHPTSGLYPLKGCFHGGHSMGTRVAGTVASQIALKGSEPAAATTVTTITATTPKKKRATREKKATTKDSDSTTTVSSPDFPQDFITGLILYSYPLHTQDNTKSLRDQILYNIPSTTPTLFVSGLNDSMCSTTLFEKVFADMKSSPREVIRVKSADHGLGFGNSLASQARKERLIESIVEWTVAFMDDSIARNTTGKKKKTAKNTAAAADVVTKKTAVLEKNNGDEWTLSLSADV